MPIKLFFAVVFLILSYSFATATPLLIDDPLKLEQFEKEGLSLSELVFTKRTSNNQELAQVPRYTNLAEDLTADLNDLRKTDPQLGPGMSFTHRLFHSKWLTSQAARFELVGIVNRLDRAVFNPDRCGEIRFIYRLAYTKKQNTTSVESRLPMTANAVFFFPEGTSCKDLAKLWLTLDSTQLKQWAKPENLKSLELNLQATRWPSTTRGDMGGHAEYFLRVYKLNSAGHLNLAPLENTPDVELINKNPALKAELLQWLSQPQQIQDLDKGILNIPEKFLARKTSSFALHGMNRLANRPFDQIFKKDDFKTIDYKNLEYVYGPSSMRRRLNDLTCAGCHQGRTIAGFHFLGKDSEKTIFANSIFSSRSPHLISDIERRITYFNDLLNDKKPDAARPFSERDPKILGKANEHCGFPNSEFQSWKCAPGLTCTSVISPATSSELGLCLPNESLAGLPCETGTISQTANDKKDSLTKGTPRSCGAGYICQNTRVGFPGGMCSKGCANLKPGETCGSIAVLAGFNDCLARKKPFAECLANNTQPGALQACDETTPCREDYICTKTKEGKGACIPPYFLFQLRVDGHPEP
ncbi:hypothetical protein [Bdellovibrio reynosensis]|uniref:Cytochrome c domain-containing protein n=1 Tax=Bdellovibrio reynosensis TaxID=2835041 RepID=A0ABY4CD21_9BACT|nr:hypothetical protein [Bdellovibrio reynosensis]UOF02733.1 hypothetical protein MNR06_07190 [Bdellovibrio reynosensis]